MLQKDLILVTLPNPDLKFHAFANAHLISLARTIAPQHSLDPALVCAVVEQESSWDSHAIRYEPAFRTRYVAPLGLPPTEEIARSISWGLMQVMGQVAREHGFTGKFLSALCEPAAGLDIGCVVLASKLAVAARELAENSLAAHIPPGTPSSLPSEQGTATSPAPPLSNSSGLQAPGSASTSPVAAGNALTHRALLLWNGGADPSYASQVLARLANYQ
jgi:hypothetical protein